MFGGLFQSPKSRLTNYLVDTLNEFFVIDRELVIANLLSDTRIVLRNVGLRSIVYDSKQLTGSIENIEFTWKWGGNENTQFIREVILTIQGARFLLKVTDKPPPPSVPTEATEADSTPEKSGYIQGIIQQVIDHLTLRIVDVELAVETPKSDTFSVHTESIELKTSESSSSGLSQILSVTGLRASVQRKNLVFHILDLIGYSAHVKRTSGQRFVSGAMHGLTVLGSIADDSSRMCLHLDTTQAQILSDIFEMFVGDDNHPSMQERDWEGFQDTLDPTATVVTLPLPALTIQLSKSTIQTSDSVFLYRMDGSLCELSGTKGIYLDGGLPFLSLEDNVSWKIDFKSSRVSLEGALAGSVASLTWDEAEMNGLLVACREISSATSSTVKAQVEDAVRQEIESLDSAWSLLIPGSLSLVVTGCNGEFLEMNLSNASAKVNPDGSVAALGFDGFKLGPATSFGELSLSIPSAQLVGGYLCCQDPVEFTAESEEVLLGMAAFSQRLVGMGENDVRVSTPEKPRALLFGISLPAIEFSVLGASKKRLKLESFCLTDRMKLKIGSALASDSSNSEASLKGIEVQGLDTLEAVQLSVDAFESFYIPNVVSLDQAISNAFFAYKSDCLTIKLPSFCVKPLLLDTVSSSRGDNELRGVKDQMQFSLPFAVKLDVGAIILSATNKMKGTVQLDGLHIHLEPQDMKLHVELKEPFALRLFDIEGNYVDSRLGKFGCTVEQSEAGSWCLTSFSLLGISASSSSSIGPTTLKIPSIAGCSRSISIQEGVKVSGASSFFARNIQAFVQRICSGTPQASDRRSGLLDLPPIDCGSISIQADDPEIQVTIPGASWKVMSTRDVSAIYSKDIAVKTVSSAIRLELTGLTLTSRKEMRGSIEVEEVQIDLLSLGDQARVELTRPLSLCVRDTEGNYLNLQAQRFWSDFALPGEGGWSLESMTMKDISTSTSTSIGSMSIYIPCLVGSNKSMSVKGVAKVSKASAQTANNLQAFVERIRPSDSASQRTHPELPMLPSIDCDGIAMQINDAEMDVSVTGVSLRSNVIQIISVSFQDKDGLFGSAETILLPLPTSTGGVKVDVGRLLTLRVPHVLEIQTPVHDMSLCYEDGALSSALLNASVKLLKPKRMYEPVGAIADILPFPVQMKCPNVTVFFEDLEDMSLVVEGIDALAVPGVGISLSNDGPLTGRLTGSSGKWLDATLCGPFLMLKPTFEGWKPDCLSCDIVQIGPSSFGHMDLRCTALSMQPGTNTICVDDNVEALITDTSDVMSLHSEFGSLIGFYDQDGAPNSNLSVNAKSMSVVCTEPKGEVKFEGIELSSTNLNCTKVRGLMEDGSAGTLMGIKSALTYPHKVSVASVTDFIVPGVFSLEKPIDDIAVVLGDELFVRSSDVHIALLRKINESQGENYLSLPDLAQPIRLSLGNLTVSPAVGSKDITKVELIEFCVANNPAVAMGKQVLAFSGNIGKLENKLLTTASIYMSGMVHEGSPVTVSRFTASLGQTSLVAGFSDVDWLGAIGRNPDTTCSPIAMPNALVKGLTVTLAYEGMLVGSETSVRVEEFRGRPSTTSDDIVEHIKASVMRKVPSFITNAKFMGENVADSTARGIAMAAMSKSLTGATMGSVTGLVAADSVRGAISAGKQARGADKNEGYKFGDFTRGAIHALGHAAQSPGGAAKATGNYVKENKGRLGAAGGQAIGMTVGLAMMGPVGWVAGAYVGAKAGQKAVGGSAKMDDDRQNVDLLGLENTSTPTPQAACSSAASPAAAFHQQGRPPPPNQQQAFVSQNQRMLLQSQNEPSAPDFFDSFDVANGTIKSNIGQGSSTEQMGMQQTQQFQGQSFFGQPQVSAGYLGQGHCQEGFQYTAQTQPLYGQGHSQHAYQNYGQPNTQRGIQGSHQATVYNQSTSYQGTQQSQPGHLSNPYSHVQPQLHGQHQQPVQQQQPTFQYSHQAQTYPQGNMRSQDVQLHQQQPQARSHSQQQQVLPHTNAQQSTQQQQMQGYKFGDATRSVINAGKKKRGGQEDEGYKFGDFTRGLFGT